MSKSKNLSRSSQHDNKVKHIDKSTPVHDSSKGQTSDLRLTMTREKLLQEVNKHLSETEYNPSIKLSRFGIKTPSDFKLLLNSPAGKTIIDEIAEQQAINKALQEDQQQKARARALRIARIKAFLFLCFIKEKAHASNKKRLLIDQENEKAIERAKPVEERTLTNRSSSSVEVLNLTQAYNLAIEQAQKKMTEGEELEKQLAKIILQKEQLDSKYTIFEEQLQHFEQSYQLFFNLTPEDLATKIDEQKNRVNELLNKVQMALERNEDHQATLLGQQINGINLLVAALHDMSAVRKQLKFYADVDGNEVHSYKDAEFILNRGDKIIKHNNKHYLVKASDDWEQIKENERALEKAHHQLIEAKLLNKLVIHNKGLEYDFNSKRREETEQSIKSNFAEQMNIANEINQLASLHANIQHDMSQTGAEQTAPAPTLRPSFSSKSTDAPQVNKTPASSTIKAKLEQLKANKSTTYQDFLTFTEQLPAGDAKTTLTNMLPLVPRTGPIPELIMNSLLQNMARFGADPYKPALTPNRTPNAEQAEQRQTPYPTPFKTTPY